MIGALVLRNFHHQRWLFGSLLLGVFVMEIFMVAMGAALDENAGLNQMFEAMPPAFRSMAMASSTMFTPVLSLNASATLPDRRMAKS